MLGIQRRNTFSVLPNTYFTTSKGTLPFQSLTHQNKEERAFVLQLQRKHLRMCQCCEYQHQFWGWFVFPPAVVFLFPLLLQSLNSGHFKKKKQWLKWKVRTNCIKTVRCQNVHDESSVGTLQSQSSSPHTENWNKIKNKSWSFPIFFKYLRSDRKGIPVYKKQVSRVAISP